MEFHRRDAGGVHAADVPLKDEAGGTSDHGRHPRCVPRANVLVEASVPNILGDSRHPPMSSRRRGRFSAAPPQQNSMSVTPMSQVAITCRLGGTRRSQALDCHAGDGRF